MDETRRERFEAGIREQGAYRVDRRAPLILVEQEFHPLTEAVCNVVEQKRMPFAWYAIFAIATGLLMVLGISVGWLFYEGTGIWGLNVPVGWGWAIVNFVFWVGIGHAGTLISAILYLFRQKWRTSINRSAEAMTIFAVMCALLFPTIHVGRVWVIWWSLPIPNQMEMWPQFRSPLLWDVFAVSIYGTVSVVFWYMGMIPDLGTMRDRAKTKIRKIAYGIFALGWRGSARHWLHYERAYLLLAALATPLVLSVHSVVSFDFAVSQVPGWHTTIFPPYFVAGAIFSGFAMVITLMVVAHRLFHLEHIITMRHFDNMAKIILVTGTMVGYAYSVEFFIAWYSGNEYEGFAFTNRMFGDYAWAYWIMVSCNVLSPQLFWFKRFRTNLVVLFIMSIFVNIGMWFERFVIVVTSLHHDFLPSSWAYYSPTIWDVATLLGSFGLFFFMFCLFIRYLPMVALSEIKGVIPAADPHHPPEPPASPPASFGGPAAADAAPAISEGSPSPAEDAMRSSPRTASGEFEPVPGAEPDDAHKGEVRAGVGAEVITAKRRASRRKAAAPEAEPPKAVEPKKPAAPPAVDDLFKEPDPSDSGKAFAPPPPTVGEDDGGED